MAWRENPALAGALIGLAIGWVKYMLALSMIGAAAVRMVLLADVPIMTAFGYYVGQLLW